MSDRTQNDEAIERISFLITGKEPKNYVTEVERDSAIQDAILAFNETINVLIARAGQAVMSDGRGEGTNCLMRDWLEAQRVKA